jgi:hypothetical protein
MKLSLVPARCLQMTIVSPSTASDLRSFYSFSTCLDVRLQGTCWQQLLTEDYLSGFGFRRFIPFHGLLILLTLGEGYEFLVKKVHFIFQGR